MGIIVEELLAGPRGRLACLEIAEAWELRAALAEVAAAGDPTGADRFAAQRTDEPNLGWAVAEADGALDPNPQGASYGITAVFAEFGGLPSPDDMRRAQEEHVARRTAQRANPAPAIAGAAAALARVPLLSPTAAELAEAVAQSVGAARGWQPPTGTDVLLARPEMRPGLERIAEVLAASALTAWWASPVDLADQWLAHDQDIPGPPERWDTPTPARTLLENWAEVNAASEEAGEELLWGTAPFAFDDAGNGFASTYGTFQHDGRGGHQELSPLASGTPTRFVWQEDEGPHGEELWAAAFEAPPGARVYEIRGEADWVGLCQRFPFNVSRSYGPYGREALYLDDSPRSEHWVTPDWRRVAEEFDAVHLSVIGYLACATRPIEVPGHGVSGLAAWDPGETIWLCDTPQSRDLSLERGTLRRWDDAGIGDWVEATSPA